MISILNKLFAFDTHRHPIDKVADLNSLISGLALYPQLIKVFISHSAAGISTVSFFIIATNSIIWIIYGVHRQSIPLLVSSSLNFISSVGVLMLIILRN